MNTLDTQYINLLEDVLKNGTDKNDRTGVGTRSVTGRMIQHNMSEGFPALTTKKLYFKTMAVELEGFIKGITDKRWYQERGCHIWDSWSSSKTRPKNISAEDWHDLGPIYGAMWRNFNNSGIDQLQQALDSLVNNPSSRRILVSAWNPQQLEESALPPCHYSFQFVTRNNYLDLVFNMRSVDCLLGMPFDIASYGLMLSLVSHQTGFKPGILTGFFADTHIYNNHFEQVKEQISRLDKAYDLPQLKINDSFKNILELNVSNDVELINYQYHPTIKANIAI